MGFIDKYLSPSTIPKIPEAESSPLWMKIILHLSFLPMLIMAMAYYKERIYTEASSDIFYILNFHDFKIIHNRIILIAAQWMGFLAYKAGAGLEPMLKIFSFTYWLYFYLIFLFTLHYLKDSASSLGIILCQSIVILYTFYNTPMSELWFGTGLLIVFSSMLLNNKVHKRLDQFLLVLISLFLLNAHPALFLLIPFVLIFDILSNGPKRIWLYVMLVILFCLGLFKIDTYESSEISRRYFTEGNNFWSEFLSAFDPLEFATFICIRYTAVSILLALVLLYYSFQKDWPKLILTFSCFVLYLLVMNFSNGMIITSDSGGLEIYYIPIVAIVGIPFLYDIYRRLTSKLNIIVTIILLSIALNHMHEIYRISPIYQARTAFMERLLKETSKREGDKYLISAENIIHHNPMLVWWSYPMESMILSSFNGSENTKSFVVDIDDEYMNYKFTITDSSLFWGAAFPSNLSFINTNYFSIEASPYRAFNTNTHNDKAAVIENICVVPIDNTELHWTTAQSCKQDFICDERSNYLNIRIENKEMDTLHSGLENHLYISYQWFMKGKRKRHQSILTPLEVDVLDDYIQPIAIHSPKDAGTYLLKIDFVLMEQIHERNFRYKKLIRDLKGGEWLDIGFEMEVTVDAD